ARRLGGPRRTTGRWGEGLVVRADRDGLHDLAVDGRVGLAGAQPGDVVVAGAAVERVDLVVAREGVQDVVAVTAELVVDAPAAPEEVAPGAAVERVVAGSAVDPAQAVGAGGEGVVALAAPDHRAAFRGRDRVVACAAEDVVAVHGAGDHVVAAGAANDVEPARPGDARHGEADAEGEREDDELASHEGNLR